MFALVYVSKATLTFSEDLLLELAEHASRNNELLKISGYLSFRRGKFVQYLEGDEKVVLALKDKISNDDRHLILNDTHLPNTESRRFQSWHMRYLNPKEIVDIGLDHLLEEVLTKMNSEIYSDERVQRITTHLVSSIAHFYNDRYKPLESRESR